MVMEIDMGDMGKHWVKFGFRHQGFLGVLFCFSGITICSFLIFCVSHLDSPLAAMHTTLPPLGSDAVPSGQAAGVGTAGGRRKRASL